MEVRVGRSFMLPLFDERGQVRRNFPEGRVRFEKALQRPLEERAELVIEARGFTTLRVADLRPLPERDLDLGVLREVRFDLIREVVHHDDQPLDRRQRADDPVEDGSALHGQERLGNGLGVRAQAGALTGRKDDGVHAR